MSALVYVSQQNQHCIILRPNRRAGVPRAQGGRAGRALDLDVAGRGSALYCRCVVPVIKSLARLCVRALSISLSLFLALLVAERRECSRVLLDVLDHRDGLCLLHLLRDGLAGLCDRDEATTHRLHELREVVRRVELDEKRVET